MTIEENGRKYFLEQKQEPIIKIPTIGTYKVPRFIADNKELVGDALNFMLSGKDLLFQAPAGAGKSYIFLYYFIPQLVRQGYKVLFLVPFAPQRDQIEKDLEQLKERQNTITGSITDFKTEVEKDLKQLKERQNTITSAITGFKTDWYSSEKIKPFSGRSAPLLKYVRNYRTKFKYPISRLKEKRLPVFRFKEWKAIHDVPNILDIIAVYSENYKVDKDLTKTPSALVVTYDKAELGYKQLQSIAAADNAKIATIIDEPHLITKSRDFRIGAIKNVELLARRSDLTCHVTATPNLALSKALGLHRIVVERERNPNFLFNVLIPSGHEGFGRELDIFHQVKKALLSGRKAFVMVNDYNKIILTVSKMLVLDGIVSENEIDVFTGERTNLQKPHAKYLAEHSRFRDGAKVVFSTDVLKQAVNVWNDNYLLLYYPVAEKDKDPKDYTQFVNRVRLYIEKCVNIECITFLPEKFINKGELKHDFDELRRLKYYNYEAVKNIDYSRDRSKKLPNSEAIESINIELNNIKKYVPKLPPLTDPLTGKDWPALFAAAELAEKDGYKMLTYSGLKRGIAEFNPEGTCYFSIPEKVHLTTQQVQKIRLLASAAKDYVSGIKKRAKVCVYDGVVNHGEDRMLSFFKAVSKNKRLASRINLQADATPPDGFVEVDERIFMNTLENFVSLRLNTEYSESQCITFLYNEASTVHDMVLTGCRKAEHTYRLAKSLVFLNLAKEENYRVSSETLQAIFLKNKLFRFTSNVLSEVFKEVANLAHVDIDDERNKLKEKEKALKAKIRETSKNRTVNKERLRAVQSKLKSLLRDSKSDEMGVQEILDNISHNSVISNSNFNKRDLSIILNLLSNAQKKGRKWVIPATFELRLNNYAKEIREPLKNVKTGFLECYLERFEQYSNKIFNSSDELSKQQAEILAPDESRIRKDIANIGRSPQLDEPPLNDIIEDIKIDIDIAKADVSPEREPTTEIIKIEKIKIDIDVSKAKPKPKAAPKQPVIFDSGGLMAVPDIINHIPF